jgi:hypothetical protein
MIAGGKQEIRKVTGVTDNPTDGSSRVVSVSEKI